MVTPSTSSAGLRLPQRSRGFTLLELMIVAALVAIVLGLAAPSFRDFILVQRLKGVNAQIVTDMQFARSEAASRSSYVRVRFQSAGAESPPMSCYIIYVDQPAPGSQPVQSLPLCDCKATEGARCTAAATRELRTVQVPSSSSVSVQSVLTMGHYVIDPRTGGTLLPLPDAGLPFPGDFGVNAFIDSGRAFRDVVGPSGRIRTCIPSGSSLPGDPC